MMDVYLTDKFEGVLINYDVVGESSKMAVLSAERTNAVHRLHVTLTPDLSAITCISHWPAGAVSPRTVYPRADGE